ncbi:Serine/threonine-protein kinase 4 [Physocladia obscura]|uniref:non-specific serine/threonine protein kinase n=1 Tax=Physocladia obscura TaxID=109957 RepID=A0AAD5TBW8_9FUNG|nr:Serine/threonine-protein kinase 4 [Physocladia obscura]
MGLLTDDELVSDPTLVFDLCEKIGEGSFGSVHRAIHRRSAETVAIKIVPAGSTDLAESIAEIDFMTGISSQFVVAYYGSYLKDTELWIVMEYCGAGSVSDVMEANDMTLSEDQISVVCRYVLSGLSYMHSLRKIHRDVKAGNILLNADCEAKLADFSVSGQLSDANAKRQTVIGTPFWMVAPEVIQEVGYGTPADIWSLGITCIEMADGRPPYSDIHPMRAIFMIPSKPPPKLFEEERYSKVFREFVARCLVKDQKDRPSADELLNVSLSSRILFFKNSFKHKNFSQDPFILRNPSVSNLSAMVNVTLQNRKAQFVSESGENSNAIITKESTAETLNSDQFELLEDEYSFYEDEHSGTFILLSPSLLTIYLYLPFRRVCFQTNLSRSANRPHKHA